MAPVATAFYLLSPEVGEPPGVGDEDAVSMTKRDDPGNSVRSSRIELHQHTPLENPLWLRLLESAGCRRAFLRAPGVPCFVSQTVSPFGVGGEKLRVDVYISC